MTGGGAEDEALDAYVVTRLSMPRFHRVSHGATLSDENESVGRTSLGAILSFKHSMHPERPASERLQAARCTPYHSGYVDKEEDRCECKRRHVGSDRVRFDGMMSCIDVAKQIHVIQRCMLHVACM
jgi:hypothetical protein